MQIYIENITLEVNIKEIKIIQRAIDSIRHEQMNKEDKEITENLHKQLRNEFGWRD